PTPCWPARIRSRPELVTPPNMLVELGPQRRRKVDWVAHSVPLTHAPDLFFLKTTGLSFLEKDNQSFFSHSLRFSTLQTNRSNHDVIPMSRRAWPIELGSGCRRLRCTCERGHGPKFREQRVDATAGNVGCDS